MNLISIFLTLTTIILGTSGVLHRKNKNKGIFDYASSFLPKVTDYFAKSSLGSHHHKNEHKDEYHDDHYYHKDEHHHHHHKHPHSHPHPQPHPHQHSHHHKGEYPIHNGLSDFDYFGHNFYNIPTYGGHFNDYHFGGYPYHHNSHLYGSSFGDLDFHHF